MRGLLIGLGGAAIATMLAGCTHSGFPDYSELPPDYSPRYTTMSVVTPSGREKRVIVPEACLTPDTESDAEMGLSRIPPGCANNWNALQSAERKQDFVKGRAMDKAPAVLVARPAQRYIDSRGASGPLGGAVESSTGSSDTGTASTSVSGSSSSSGRY
jgi:hypothetical protein